MLPAHFILCIISIDSYDLTHTGISLLLFLLPDAWIPTLDYTCTQLECKRISSVALCNPDTMMLKIYNEKQFLISVVTCTSKVPSLI